MLRTGEYVREDGSNAYRDWFEQLDPQAAAKVAIAVTRLSLGNTSNLKRIGAISEYRIDRGPGYRIYLAGDESTWILLGGGPKRRQSSDVERATILFSEYRRRKSERLSSRGRR